MSKKKATREGYGEGLVELGQTNPSVVVLDADVSASTKSEMFKKKFPERFFNLGVAEQNLFTVAAGLSLTGKIPYASLYGAFLGRGWEQIRVSVCYANLNVKIAGSHGGVLTGADGATHQSLEEIAIMRVLPNMKVIVPCDALETKKATIAMAGIEGPCYIRLGREPVPVMSNETKPFELGKADILKDGGDVSIIACGYMVCEALQAYEMLAKSGINARIINMHTIKPIDRNIIIQAAKETGAIVTAEEHQLMGGLGGAVAEVMVRECPVPMGMVGVQDRFGASGRPEDLLKEFHLKDVDIVEAVQKVLKRKK
jgi:transketolase